MTLVRPSLYFRVTNRYSPIFPETSRLWLSLTAISPSSLPCKKEEVEKNIKSNTKTGQVPTITIWEYIRRKEEDIEAKTQKCSKTLSTQHCVFTQKDWWIWPLCVCVRSLLLKLLLCLKYQDCKHRIIMMHLKHLAQLYINLTANVSVFFKKQFCTLVNLNYFLDLLYVVCKPHWMKRGEYY